MNRLSPVSEEPVNEEISNNSSSSNCSKKVQTWRKWIRSYFPLLSNKKSDLRILLSVLGCPLFPVSVHPQRHISHVSSSAQYIIQHFTAATGCLRLEGLMKNMYATGKVTMQVVDEGSSGAAAARKGCFVIWQMVPDKWLIEIVVGGQKVVAGSDGNVAWRHTPSGWKICSPTQTIDSTDQIVFNGLDPVAISSAFSTAQYVGEKHLSGVDCFVLKLSAEQSDLSERSDNTAETIKHVMLGYFSQRTGLLVYLEDSYLTRVQSPGSGPSYWETTMCTKVEDYRSVHEDHVIMVAHSGRSSAVITRFGDDLRDIGPGMTRMEESYVIDDLAFNVPGLSIDSFIPPREIGRCPQPTTY